MPNKRTLKSLQITVGHSRYLCPLFLGSVYYYTKVYTVTGMSVHRKSFSHVLTLFVDFICVLQRDNLSPPQTLQVSMTQTTVKLMLPRIMCLSIPLIFLQQHLRISLAKEQESSFHCMLIMLYFQSDSTKLNLKTPHTRLLDQPYYQLHWQVKK